MSSLFFATRQAPVSLPSGAAVVGGAHRAEAATMSRATWVAVLILLSAAIGCLLVTATLVDAPDLNVRGLRETLNDQVGYISVARNLVDTGQMHSNVVYPSFLGQSASKDYLYMPGHYLALAAAFRVFGAGPIQSLLPSMLAYIAASVALFTGVLRTHGRRQALAASLLFVFFPANIVYALTAMSEMTLVAAAAVAFAIFVHLPTRMRPWFGPCLLLLPLLFRETGLAVAIPMAAIMFLRGSRGLHLRATLGFLALSAIVALLFLRSDVAAGRPSLFLVNIFSPDIGSVYEDAFAAQQIHPSLIDWAHALETKLLMNAGDLVRLLWLLPWMMVRHAQLPTGDAALEWTSIALIGFSVPIGVIASLRRRDALVLGTLGLQATLALAVVLLYSVVDFRGLRIMLLAVPFGCATIVISGNQLIQGSPRLARVQHGKFFPFALLFGLAGMALACAALAPNPAVRALVASDTEFLESLGNADGSMLVSPWRMSLDYVHKHQAVQWSFIPANRATLHLLNSTHPIETVVLPAEFRPEDHEGANSLTAVDLAEEGLLHERTVSYAGRDYVIFRRKR